MKGILSVTDSDQRYVFQVLIPFSILFLSLSNEYIYNKKIVSQAFISFLIFSTFCGAVTFSGGAFYIGWLPRQNLGTQWEED